MATPISDKLFNELRVLSKSLSEESQALQTNLGTLARLPRDVAIESESAQLNLLQFGIGSMEEEVRTLNSYTASCLSLSALIEGLSEFYAHNQQALLSLDDKAQQAAARPQGRPSPEVQQTVEAPPPSQITTLTEFSPETTHQQTPCADTPMSSWSLPEGAGYDKGDVGMRFITPPPARALNFDLLQSAQKDREAQAKREWASAGDCLAKLRPQRYSNKKAKDTAPSSSENSPNGGGEQVSSFTAVTSEDLQKVSGYLLLRCTLDDINGFLNAVSDHLLQTHAREIPESELTTVTSEKNRKTLILILKNLNRLHLRVEEGQTFYSTITR